MTTVMGTLFVSNVKREGEQYLGASVGTRQFPRLIFASDQSRQVKVVRQGTVTAVALRYLLKPKGLVLPHRTQTISPALRRLL